MVARGDRSDLAAGDTGIVGAQWAASQGVCGRNHHAERPSSWRAHCRSSRTFDSVLTRRRLSIESSTCLISVAVSRVLKRLEDKA